MVLPWFMLTMEALDLGSQFARALHPFLHGVSKAGVKHHSFIQLCPYARHTALWNTLTGNVKGWSIPITMGVDRAYLGTMLGMSFCQSSEGQQEG